MYKKLEEMCLKNNTTFNDVYWKQLIKDYISCCPHLDEIKYTDDDIKDILDRVMNDDEMWSVIDDTIYYYAAKGENDE